MVLRIFIAVSMARVQRYPFITCSQTAVFGRSRIIEDTSTHDESNGTHGGGDIARIRPFFASLEPLPSLASWVGVGQVLAAFSNVIGSSRDQNPAVSIGSVFFEVSSSIITTVAACGNCSLCELTDSGFIRSKCLVKYIIILLLALQKKQYHYTYRGISYNCISTLRSISFYVGTSWCFSCGCSGLCSSSCSSQSCNGGNNKAKDKDSHLGKSVKWWLVNSCQKSRVYKCFHFLAHLVF